MKLPRKYQLQRRDVRYNGYKKRAINPSTMKNDSYAAGNVELKYFVKARLNLM
jgi:hypothetical protein